MLQKTEDIVVLPTELGKTNSSAVAVVIPFFQRQPGLLLRAVRSALDQSAGLPTVIIVDDGSPIDAKAELADLLPADLARVRVVKQSNAGPGAARNLALSSLPDSVEFVAFLDSDDAWRPEHLAQALKAFDFGADFYFTDYIPVDTTDVLSCFDWSGLDATNPCHRALGDGLYVFGGDLFDSILRRSPIGTSTVVLRKAAAGEHRFPTSFSYGEDAAYWLSVTVDRRVVFSTRSGVDYGAGGEYCSRGEVGSRCSATKVVWGVPLPSFNQREVQA